MTLADHFYTTDAKGEAALSAGYQYLGVACYVFDTAVPDAIPVYRAFYPTKDDHFYTTDRQEFDNAVIHLGYKAEAVAWFMYGKGVGSDTVALERYFSPEYVDHAYYTADSASIMRDDGTYKREGIAAGYVLTQKGWATDGTQAVPLYCWYRMR